MSYTCDYDTDEGRLRTLLYDVVPSGTSAICGTNYYFEDAALTALLELTEDDLWDAAAAGCRAMAAKYAGEAISLGLGKGDISINKQQKPGFYIQLANMYQNRSGSDTGATEYIDSVNYGVGGTGSDDTEYVGD